ncbi:MAG: hypothetical protein H0W72_13730, partial [Planctomycetes bacterium]|nr:hypothetical protein [Planctomycetota bacterium]
MSLRSIPLNVYPLHDGIVFALPAQHAGRDLTPLIVAGWGDCNPSVDGFKQGADFARATYFQLRLIQSDFLFGLNFAKKGSSSVNDETDAHAVRVALALEEIYILRRLKTDQAAAVFWTRFRTESPHLFLAFQIADFLVSERAFIEAIFTGRDLVSGESLTMSERMTIGAMGVISIADPAMVTVLGRRVVGAASRLRGVTRAATESMAAGTTRTVVAASIEGEVVDEIGHLVQTTRRQVDEAGNAVASTATIIGREGLQQIFRA